LTNKFDANDTVVFKLIVPGQLMPVTTNILPELRLISSTHCNRHTTNTNQIPLYHALY